MIIEFKYQPVYVTLKNGRKGKRIIGYEKVSEEIKYSLEESDEYGNVKPMTKAQRAASADKFFQAFTGMTTEEYAKKVLLDYNKELLKDNLNIKISEQKADAEMCINNSEDDAICI